MSVESLKGLGGGGVWTVKPAACDGSCVCSNDEWLFSLLVLWGLSGSLQPWQAGLRRGGKPR